MVIRSDRTAHNALALGFAGQVGLGRARAAGLFGPCRLKQALYILFVLKFFIILSHHYEVTHKNNYLICTNIFFKYNRQHISCRVKFLIILKLIYYFQWFK